MDQSNSMIWQMARSTKFFTSGWRALLVALLLGLNCFLVSCSDDKIVQGNGVLVSSISPSSGPVGTIVTITGAGFTTPPGSNMVSFNGKAADVNAATDTQLEVVVPVGAETGIVSVTVDGKKADGPVFTVTTTSVKHTITSATPLTGNSGTVVTINGSGFSVTPSANAITFNGVAAIVQTATATQLTVTAPAGGSTGNIAVTIAGVTVTGPVFTYTVVTALTISGITPNTGVPGTEVTITGTGFNLTPSLNVVKFNSAVALVKSATATSLVVFAPGSGKTGSVTVEIGAAKATGPVYTYPTVPTIVVFAGGSSGTSDGVGVAAQFKNPAGLAFNSKGMLYVADRDNHAIREISPDATVKLFSGMIGFSGFLPGPRLTCLYKNPTGIAVNGDDDVFVACEGSGSVSKIDREVDVSYLFAGGGGNPNAPAIGFADGLGNAARFNHPTGLSIDRFGHIYVADQSNNSVRKIITASGTVTPMGNVSTVAGSPATATFSGPTGVFVKDLTVLVGNKDGKLKVIDGVNVNDVTTISGSISGIAEDSKGNRYVLISNSSNALIKISVSGVQTGIPVAPNGLAPNKPSGIAIDRFDNIYISDSGNNRIIKITLP